MTANLLWTLRGIILVISGAFHRVWNDGLTYEIKSFGTSDTPLKPIKNFLSSRCQGLVLNGQSSHLAEVSPDVPQNSILGPFFFLDVY